MKQFLTTGAKLVVAIFGAHALAYLMLRGLPDPAIAALGLQGGNEAAVAAFEQDHPARTYGQTLLDLIGGRMGFTLDGVPVLTELSQALSSSLPRLLMGALLLGATVIITAFASRKHLKPLAEGFRFVAFLPPFAAPFLALPVVLFIAPGQLAVSKAAAVICIALPAMALLCSQTAEITTRNLSSPFAVNIRALGASRQRLRIRLLTSLLVELLPTVEKATVGLLVSLVFVEPVLGLDGFGTLVIRAIRRSDPDLVLGLVLVVAATVNLSRIISELGRLHFRLNAQ